MLEFSWRLIGQNGEVRLKDKMQAATIRNLWQILAEIADDCGRPGEVLHVLDEKGEIVVHVGVATAQGMRLRPLQAA